MLLRRHRLLKLVRYPVSERQFAVAVPVTVPRLGWSMEEGTFVEWLKRDGEPVRPGDALFILEGEKAAEHIEAIDQGVLRLIPASPQPGEVVKVGQLIAYLAAEGESVPAENAPARTVEAPAPGAALIGAE